VLAPANFSQFTSHGEAQAFILDDAGPGNQDEAVPPGERRPQIIERRGHAR